MSSNAVEAGAQSGDQQAGATWRAVCFPFAFDWTAGIPSTFANFLEENSVITVELERFDAIKAHLVPIAELLSEKKIELIDDRLARIERTLHQLANNPASIQQKSTSASPASGSTETQQFALPILTGSKHQSGNFPEQSPYEGESSFSVQTMHASRLAEKAMDPSVLPNTEMAAALSSLRNIIEKQNSVSSYQDLRFPEAQQDTTNPDIAQMELPPLAIVLSVLRICKGRTNVNKDYPLSAFVLVNGGLYYLFLELALTGDGKPEYDQYSTLCRSNFERAFANYPLLCEPTFENLQALLLGALYAIDISKPSICSALTSSAARLCQALGYHRETSLKGLTPAQTEEQQGLFWFVYVLDKTLSLRLGRASVLQDYDIDVSFPKIVLSEPRLQAWDSIHLYWIKLAEFHGLAYEQLYSPRALSESPDERAAKAKVLIDKLGKHQKSLSKIDTADSYCQEYLPVIFASCDTIYYSLLTIFYRAIPPAPSEGSSGFSIQCLQAARATLKAHYKCAQDYGEGNPYVWHGYLCWSLIHCPFAPFTVVFCNAIATSDLDDLQCLGDTVTTLQSSAEMSEGVGKLYRLCSVFYQVAKLYIESKMKADNNTLPPSNGPATETKFQPDTPMHAGGEFDPYLSALGLGPSVGSLGMPPQGDTTMEEYDPSMGMETASLGNWFAGNLNMLGLLEADLTDLDTWSI
ncbi:hypothetical protein FQN54_001438 [Arachnomyces sp. PD_36]|nr:hypothetical protein FQN54_001438 [Arachnomyces sp. PD_36]